MFPKICTNEVYISKFGTVLYLVLLTWLTCLLRGGDFICPNLCDACARFMYGTSGQTFFFIGVAPHWFVCLFVSPVRAVDRGVALNAGPRPRRFRDLRNGIYVVNSTVVSNQPSNVPHGRRVWSMRGGGQPTYPPFATYQLNSIDEAPFHVLVQTCVLS